MKNGIVQIALLLGSVGVTITGGFQGWPFIQTWVAAVLLGVVSMYLPHQINTDKAESFIANEKIEYKILMPLMFSGSMAMGYWVFWVFGGNF